MRPKPGFPTLAIAALLTALLGLPLSALAAADVINTSGLRLPNPIPASQAQTTQVFGTDGSLLAEWHGDIDRQPLPLRQISPFLQRAVVASEDARFFDRGAADILAILRALWVNFRRGAWVQGASTISQQYAKDAYVGKERSLSRKLKEVRVASRLERSLGKKEILERYLNTVYFGNGAYGVQAAARTYFQKPASDLSASESALLVGLIPSPVTYSPYSNPGRSEQRRLWVIDRMRKVGYLSSAQAAQARRERPVLTRAGRQSPRFGWFMDALRTYLVERYGARRVLSGGLKVYTTLDPQAQEGAENYLARALPGASDPYASLVSIDPNTGYVRAVVGGRDYATERFNIGIQARRQPGSAFKPFVLVAALEKGISPQASYRGPGTICLRGWVPNCRVSNFGRAGYGTLSLTEATVRSVNTVYAQLVLQVGPRAVVDVARRMGIPGPRWLPGRSGCRPAGNQRCRTELQAVPAIALGTEEVTPLEMASAFATLAAGGIYREPKMVEKVVDSSGRVLEQGPSPPRRAIEASVAQTATGILQQVISRGTGKQAGIGRPAAGKTGTAQGFQNAWFVGYTPDLATAVWMGYREGNRPMLNIRGIPRVTGGTLPAQIWREYMKLVSDRNPPALTMESGPADGATTNAGQPLYRGAAVDSDGVVGRVEASVDGGPFAESGIRCSGCPGAAVTWTFVPGTRLADGSHTVALRALDIAGHVSRVVSRTLMVDTVAPQLDGIGAAGGTPVVNARFTEPVSCSGLRPPGLAVRVGGRRAGVRSAGCSGSASSALQLTLDSRIRGGDLVEVFMGSSPRSVTDVAGNEAEPGSRSSMATNTGPSLALSQPELPPGAFPGPIRPGGLEVAGTATDTDGTVDRVEASLDGSAFSSGGVECRGCGRAPDVSWLYRPSYDLSDGPHVVRFRSVDNAGAISASASQQVTVDAIAPRMQAISATGGGSAVTATFSEPLTCSSIQGRLFRVLVAGRPAAPVLAACEGNTDATIELNLSRGPAGGDSVQVSAAAGRGSRSPQLADPAGNPSIAGTVSTVATNSPPAVALAGPSSQIFTSSTQPILQGEASDPDGVVERIEVSLDGGPFSAAGVGCNGCRSRLARFTYKPALEPSQAAHSISFRAVDGPGAVSPVKTLSVSVDTGAPIFQQLTVAAGNADLVARFSEPVLCASVGELAFQATVSGSPVPVLVAVCQGAASRDVNVRLARSLDQNEAVTLTLNGTVTDAAGNVAPPGSLDAVPAAVKDATPAKDATPKKVRASQKSRRSPGRA